MKSRSKKNNFLRDIICAGTTCLSSGFVSGGEGVISNEMNIPMYSLDDVQCEFFGWFSGSGKDETKNRVTHTLGAGEYSLDGSPGKLSLKTTQDLQLQVYEWKASNPVGIVLAVHGIDGHGRDWLRKNPSGDPGKQMEYEGSWIQKLNSRGLTCISFDFQSHGLSESHNGLAVSFQNYDDPAKHDLMNCVVAVKKRYPKLPLSVLSLSMGAGMLGLALQQPAECWERAKDSKFAEEDGTVNTVETEVVDGLLKEGIDNVVFLSGMFGVERCLSTMKVAFPILQKLDKASPDDVVVPWTPCQYAYMNKYVMEDSLHNREGYRASTLSQMTKASREARHNSARISDGAGASVPVKNVLFIHNKKDIICDWEAALKIYRTIDVKNKQFLFLNSDAEPNKVDVPYEVLAVTKEEEGKIRKESLAENVDVSHAIISEPDSARIFPEISRFLVGNEKEDPKNLKI